MLWVSSRDWIQTNGLPPQQVRCAMATTTLDGISPNIHSILMKTYTRWKATTLRYACPK